MAMFRSNHQRGEPLVVLGLLIRLAFKEHLDASSMAMLACDHQGSAPMTLLQIHLRLGIDQDACAPIVAVALLARQHQCTPTIPLLREIGVGPCLEQCPTAQCEQGRRLLVLLLGRCSLV